MAEPIETVIIRGKQQFEIENGLNPVEIEINDDIILNILKKQKNVKYRLTILGMLFPASVKNDTEQIFVTCREFNDVKKSLLNGQIYGNIGIIDLQKNWSNIKGKSLWVNAIFKEQEEISKNRHLCFQFMTSSLNYLLNFSINLKDNHNQQMNFKSDQQKISMLNFKIDVFKK